MRAEEFYKQRSNSVRELWVLSPKQIEYIALIMEEYAALRIHNVVEQSEQLVCEYCNEDAKPTCCDSCLESMVNAVQKAN